MSLLDALLILVAGFAAGGMNALAGGGTFFSFPALLAVGLTPTLLGLAGVVYFAVALLLGIAFLACGVASALRPSPAAARRVMVASLIYLPVLLGCMAWDKVGL